MADKWNLDGLTVNDDNVAVLPTYTVATVPAVVTGGIIYVSDGAAGSPTLAVCDGSNWLRTDTNATVAAS